MKGICKIAPLALALLSGGSLAVAACSTGDWVQSIADDGAIVVLDDGSVWMVNSSDRSSSADWQDLDDVIVCDDGTLVDTDETAGYRTVHATEISDNG